jgi:beta-lactamase regulating signal transducer with metallopeptidase domain
MIEILGSVIGWTLVHSLWQGTVVALATTIFLAVMPRASARTRYAILCGALFAHLAAPVATAVMLVPRALASVDGSPSLTHETSPTTVSIALGRGETVTLTTGGERSVADSRGYVAAVTDIVTRTRLERFLPVVVLAWVTGVVVGAVRRIGGWLLLRRLIARASPAATELGDRVRSLARTMGIHRKVAVLVSSDVEGPFTSGWLRPVIVMPLSMLSGLDPVHVNAIVAHELAHIRRWDYFVAIIQSVALTVLFHHPVTWWLDRRLRVEREYCCDDIAVAASQDRVGYVRALAELESLRLGLPSLALAATGGSLQDRVVRLLSGRNASAPAGWAPAAAVIAVLFAASVVNAAAAPADVVAAGPVRVDVVAPNESVDAPPMQQGGVIRHPDASAPFEARWNWALDQARRRDPSDEVVIGWLVRSAVSDGSMIVSSTDNSSDQRGGRFVGDLLGSTRDADRGVAILLTWTGGGGGDLIAVRLRDLRSRLTLGDRALLWLHSVDDASSVARLERLIATTDAHLRSELAAALSLHDNRSVMLPAVRRVLDTDRDSRVRAEAVSWLGNHANDSAVAALLRRAADDPEPDVRDEAVSALGGGGRASRAVLLELIASSKHADVRGEAVQQLNDGGDEAIPTLLRIAFGDPDADVQAEAVDAIKETGGGAATRALRDIAQRHPSRRLRSEARDALDERGIR